LQIVQPREVQVLPEAGREGKGQGLALGAHFRDGLWQTAQGVLNADLEPFPLFGIALQQRQCGVFTPQAPLQFIQALARH